MKIGFVSYWFNRGQAVVTRYIKSIFDEAGFETFVLVRRGKLATTEDDWQDKNITIGSLEYDMPVSTYLDWAKENKIEVCFFDQNYQFDAIQAMKEMGVKTIGRFVWEQFAKEHAISAKKAFDIIYSLTQAEQKRYLNKMDIDSPLISWGIHPSLLNHQYFKNKDSNVWFYFPAGYCNERKNIEKTLAAFRLNKKKNIRLLISSQKAIAINDSRIKLVKGNVSKHEDFHKLMSQCHVCLIPSKWEGLGLSFMEAIAFNMPIITTDFPPMNEYVVNEKTGLLIKCQTAKRLENGLKIADLDVMDFAKKIHYLSNHEKVNQMVVNIDSQRNKFSWEITKQEYLKLISG